MTIEETFLDVFFPKIPEEAKVAFLLETANPFGLMLDALNHEGTIKVEIDKVEDFINYCLVNNTIITGGINIYDGNKITHQILYV